MQDSMSSALLGREGIGSEIPSQLHVIGSQDRQRDSDLLWKCPKQTVRAAAFHNLLILPQCFQ